MKCNRYDDIIMRYFDHALLDGELEQLNKHMESCSDCRALVEDLSGIMQTLETAPQVEPPSDMEKIIINRLKSLPASEESGSNNFLKALYGSMSVAAVMLACVVILGVYDGMLSLVSQGAGGLNSLIESAWNVQVVYNLLTEVFSQMINSILNTIQAVYILAGLAAIIIGFKKLVLSGSDFQKEKN